MNRGDPHEISEDAHGKRCENVHESAPQSLGKADATHCSGRCLCADALRGFSAGALIEAEHHEPLMLSPRTDRPDKSRSNSFLTTA